MNQKISRRRFLTLAGMGGVGLGLAACAPREVPTPTSAMAMGSSGTPTADDMDAEHEKRVKEFLANAEKNAKTFWPARLPYKMDGNVKVFELDFVHF